jgi:hypothetical protein
LVGLEKTMDVLSVFGAILGLAGIVLGGLGWRKASEAKAIANSALHLHLQAAQEAKRPVAEAPQVAPETNAVATPVTQPAVVAARAPDTTQVAPGDAEQTARLVVRSGSNPGEDLPTNQGSGSGLIGIFLVNEGPAPAHDMQLHAIFPNGTRRSSELHRTLSAHRELTLFAQVVPPDFGTADPLHVHYEIAYQDGNGEQALERDIRLEGGWKGPWKTFIETNG